MDKNTVDVLFLGSSVTVNAFIPQELYNTYGIRSYNLGCEQQSMYLTYYWLREALRFQTPKAVVLDTKFMWPVHPEDPINTVEALTRKCIDSMKYSKIKAEAIHELCKIDKNQSELSYYLTNIRYHSRWTELGEYDIDDEFYSISELKGYGPISTYGVGAYDPYVQIDPEITMEFPDLMQEYLDKIVSLCKENNISLLLVSLPGNEMNDAVNNTLTKYADDKEIDYYNLCSTDYYNQIGAVLPIENVITHENIWGAIKMSRYIGAILQDRYQIESVQDPQYELTKDYYIQTIKNANLVHINDTDEYLRAIYDDHYAVFFTVRNSLEYSVTDAAKEDFRLLGLKRNFDENPTWSYYAVIIPNEGIIEEVAEEGLKHLGSLNQKHTFYTIQSAGNYEMKNRTTTGSVLIDGVEYSINVDGLNIIVYDTVTKHVIDRVVMRGDIVAR